MKYLSKEQTKPIAVQSQIGMPQQDPLAQKMNKITVKYNAKQMLEQEFGESLSEYINTANAIITELKKKLADAEASLVNSKPKETKP